MTRRELSTLRPPYDQESVDALVEEYVVYCENVKLTTGLYPYEHRMTELQRICKPVQDSMSDVIRELKRWLESESA